VNKRALNLATLLGEFADANIAAELVDFMLNICKQSYYVPLGQNGYNSVG
jgi:hypothetical protein